jgi:hypothetical protein
VARSPRTVISVIGSWSNWRVRRKPAAAARAARSRPRGSSVACHAAGEGVGGHAMPAGL